MLFTGAVTDSFSAAIDIVYVVSGIRYSTVTNCSEPISTGVPSEKISVAVGTCVPSVTRYFADVASVTVTAKEIVSVVDSFNSKTIVGSAGGTSLEQELLNPIMDKSPKNKAKSLEFFIVFSDL